MKIVTLFLLFPTMKTLVYLLLSSCLATPLFGQHFLVPNAFDRKYDDSKVAVIDNDDHVVIIENLERNAAALVFDVEIRNFSLRELDVSPVDMRMLASDHRFPTLAESDQVTVTNFERDLNHYAALNSDEAVEGYHKLLRSRKALGIALVALAAGLATWDAVKDAQEWQSSIWTDAMANKSATRDFITMAGIFSADMANSIIREANLRHSEDMHFIHQEILEYTLVKPMEAVRGKVFFPGGKHKYSRIIIPLADNEYVFDFRKPTGKERQYLKKQNRR
jgi:hypothetical protein